MNTTCISASWCPDRVEWWFVQFNVNPETTSRLSIVATSSEWLSKSASTEEKPLSKAKKRDEYKTYRTYTFCAYARTGERDPPLHISLIDGVSGAPRFHSWDESSPVTPYYDPVVSWHGTTLPVHLEMQKFPCALESRRRYLNVFVMRTRRSGGASILVEALQHWFRALAYLNEKSLVLACSVLLPRLAFPPNVASFAYWIASRSMSSDQGRKQEGSPYRRVRRPTTRFRAGLRGRLLIPRFRVHGWTIAFALQIGLSRFSRFSWWNLVSCGACSIHALQLDRWH